MFDTLNTIAALVQAVVVLVGFPFLIIQVRQQTEAIQLQTETFRLTTYLQLMAESSRLSEMMFADSSLGNLYRADSVTPTDWQKMNEQDRKLYLYLGRLLSFMEQTFVLSKQKWMDEYDSKATWHQLHEILDLPAFKAWWPALKPYYRADFGHFVENFHLVRQS